MTFIIAEAGINHNGDIKLAEKLVDAAKESGADAVKFQTFDHITRLEKYRLSKNDFLHLKVYCDEKGIIFSSTPHTFEAIHFIDKLVPFHKIASTYLGNANFLMEVAKKGKQILLSTGNILNNNGMSSMQQIIGALLFIPDANVTLMHCVSKYPCKNPHYERIGFIQDFFVGRVGLSDHSKKIKVPKVPIIEKHIMLDDVNCIDSEVSLTPSEFKKMVNYVRRTK